MQTIALLTAAALAAEPEWFEVKRGDDCVLYKAPAEIDGVAPMKAECYWPDVDPAALQRKLADYPAYAGLIFAITKSEVVRRDGDRALVHQVQVTQGLSPREVMIWMTTEALPDGGQRVGWATAGDEPLERGPGSVRSPRNDGSWEVWPDPAGGSKVVHRIAYSPGGSVPGWVVRWFQVNGMFQVLRDVHDAAR